MWDSSPRTFSEEVKAALDDQDDDAAATGDIWIVKHNLQTRLSNNGVLNLRLCQLNSVESCCSKVDTQLKDEYLAKSIESLDISINRLQSLDGIRIFSGLSVLKASVNGLLQVPDLQYHTKLEELVLSNNKISSLSDFRVSNTLVRLDLSVNDLSVLSLPILPKLESLDVSRNKLTQISSLRASCPNVKDLKIQGNLLEIPFELPNKVKILNIGGNPISKTDAVVDIIEGLSMLTELFLETTDSIRWKVLQKLPNLMLLDGVTIKPTLRNQLSEDVVKKEVDEVIRALREQHEKKFKGMKDKDADDLTEQWLSRARGALDNYSKLESLLNQDISSTIRKAELLLQDKHTSVQGVINSLTDFRDQITKLLNERENRLAHVTRRNGRNTFETQANSDILLHTPAAMAMEINVEAEQHFYGRLRVSSENEDELLGDGDQSPLSVTLAEPEIDRIILGSHVPGLILPTPPLSYREPSPSRPIMATTSKSASGSPISGSPKSSQASKKYSNVRKVVIWNSMIMAMSGVTNMYFGISREVIPMHKSKQKDGGEKMQTEAKVQQSKETKPEEIKQPETKETNKEEIKQQPEEPKQPEKSQETKPEEKKAEEPKQQPEIKLEEPKQQPEQPKPEEPKQQPEIKPEEKKPEEPQQQPEIKPEEPKQQPEIKPEEKKPEEPKQQPPQQQPEIKPEEPKQPPPNSASALMTQTFAEMMKAGKMLWYGAT